MSYTNPVDQPIITAPDPNNNNELKAYYFVNNQSNLLDLKPSAANPITYTSIDAYQGMLNAFNPTFLSNFFTQYNNPNQQPAGYPLPMSWDSFVTQFTAQGGQPSQLINVQNAFITSYKKFLNMTTSIPGAPPDGDFSLLAASGVTDADILNQFKNSFTHFLLTYPFPNGQVYSFGTSQQFFDNWIKYMTNTAVLQSATGSAGGNAPGLPAFEQIWNSYGLPAVDFQAALKTFHDNILIQTGNGKAANGYFVPSQVFSAWIDSVKQQYLNTIIVSSVSTTGGDEVLVIDRILRLLIQMIGILQKISASQADRLRFLTKWQSVYTNLLTDIPTFTQGDGSAIDGDIKTASHQFGGNPNNPGSGNISDQKKKEALQRDLINPKMQALQDKTRARRDNIADQAKAMQSIINQSQTNANAQTDMATAFLTELSTILGAIFK